MVYVGDEKTGDGSVQDCRNVMESLATPKIRHTEEMSQEWPL